MKTFILVTLAVLALLNNQQCDAFLEQLAARLPLGGTPSPLGSPWPLPHYHSTSKLEISIDPQNLEFRPNVPDCDILNEAIKRYNLDFLLQGESANAQLDPNPKIPPLSYVAINIAETADLNLCNGYPQLSKDPNYESYSLRIRDDPIRDDLVGSATITATTVWGALRGLETFSQLVWRSRDWSTPYYYVNLTEIRDQPRYPHRGLMMDTARHYLPARVILEILDGMAYNKLNVLHWHIVDDQSFPFVSETFPELSEKGAYVDGALVYNRETIENVIEHARLRGIRVIFEFDTPGHTYIYKKSHPELLTPCYGEPGKPGTPNWGKHADFEILDPTKESTYTFMKALFTEIVNDVTKDEHVHLGMDETYHACWESSPEIAAFMNDNGYSTFAEVEGHYATRHLDMVRGLGAKPIIWQDPLDYNVELSPDKAIIQVWKSENWQESFQKYLDQGYSLLLSSCWYLNLITYGESWKDYYNCDPELSLPTPPTEEQKARILGGEAAVWGEYVDGTNVIQRFFPYVGAVAERLWSLPKSSSADDAKWRLDEHRCRLMARGIKAQPIYNGYCGPNDGL